MDYESLNEVEEGNFYEVEKILDKRKMNGVIKYKIKWRGWDDPKDLTWEPIQNLTHLGDMIQAFDSNKKNEEISLKKKLIKKPKRVNQITKIDKREKLSKKISSSNVSSSESDSSNEQNESQSSESRNPEQKFKIDEKKKKEEVSKYKPSVIQIKSKYKSKIEEESQKSFENQEEEKLVVQDSELQIDQINKIILKKKQIYYDVDVVNNEGLCLGVKLYSNQIVRKKVPEKIVEFLEDYLIQRKKNEKKI